MFSNLLPPQVEFVHGDPQKVSGSLYPQEDYFSGPVAPKRRQEFIAGRVLASEVLARLGVKDFPLQSGKNREPLWPPGIVGSITHARGICAVAVSRHPRIKGLGIDVERVDRLKQEILPTVCTPEELNFLTAQSPDDRQRLAMLIFSAKESLYKCQYPRTQEFLGFQDVSIEIRVEEKKIIPYIKKDLSSQIPQGLQWEGRYCFENGYVATSMILCDHN